jgi:hypothetical protein
MCTRSLTASAPILAPMHGLHKVLRRGNVGFTLVETAIVIVVFGLMAQGFLLGQQLIVSARVRNMLMQQLAVEAAFGGFQDRFRAVPGDYAAASSSIDCGAVACLNGNENGRIETGPALREDVLAWHHLTAAGFIVGNFSMQDATISSPDRDNSPVNIFGAYLQISADSAWGYSGNTSVRHNAKRETLFLWKYWRRLIERSMTAFRAREDFSSQPMPARVLLRSPGQQADVPQ